MPEPTVLVAAAIELVLLGAGAVMLWLRVLSPTARKTHGGPALGTWDAPAVNFVTFVFYVIAGYMLGAVCAGFVVRAFDFTGMRATIIGGGAAQIGMLLGVFGYRVGYERSPAPPRLAPRRFVASGVETFLISLPVLTVVNLAWQGIIKLTGLPAQRQDLVGMFANADSMWLLAVMIGLAIVVAPIAEELVFRAGFFRFMRTRTPRFVAILVPAFLFAALHANVASFVPLTALAIIFSLAYERTGHIGTPIVAHGLFNLNTILLIFSGATEFT